MTWKSAKDYTDKPVATTTVKIHGQDVPILHPENSTITPPVLDAKAEAMDQELKEMATVQGHTAKARLVLLGYQDPELTRLATASPTLGRSTRSVMLAMAAHNA